jgi:hypothetical protein
MESLPYMIAHVRSAQRVFLVIIGIVPLLLLTIAVLPAVVILPFFGAPELQRAETLIHRLTTWLRVLLHGSRHSTS